MHKLMEYICDELEELERKADKEGKLSMAEIEYIDKLAHIKKSLLSAEEMWDQSEYSEAGGGSGQSRRGGGSSYRRGGGSSRRGSSRAGGGSSYESSSPFFEGGSYARGRGSNARRDSMGRYSSDSEEMVNELRELMQDAPDQQTKQDIQRIVSRLEQM